MNILYLTYDGLTDPLGRSQILPYLVELSKEGVRYTVVSFEKEKFQSEKDEVSKIIQAIGAVWIPLKYHKEPPVFSTLYDVRKLRGKVTELVGDQKYDLVHCRSYITSIIGLELKRSQGIPFLFDMRGYWADERVDGKLWNLSNPIFSLIYKYFKRKEKEFLEEADHIISLTDASASYLRKTFNVKGISVIPCSTDTDLFNPAATSYSESGQKYIGYLGSLGTWYMIDEMVEFYKVFTKSNPEYKLLVITRDNPEPLQKAFSRKELKTDSLEIIDAERSDVPRLIQRMDAMIMFIRPVFSKTASSPTKLGEALSMNIPVVANEGVGDVVKIITETKGGVVVKDFREEEYVEASLQLSQLISTKQKNYRSWVRENLSLDFASKLYKSAYNNCLS